MTPLETILIDGHGGVLDRAAGGADVTPLETILIDGHVHRRLATPAGSP